MRAISEDEVHLWRFSLDVVGPGLASLNGSLSADELARADRFHREVDRRRFIAGRGRLRAILSGYLGLGPAEVAFQYGPSAKPFLDGGLCFNLSHSDGLALCAVTPSREVGVDVERVREFSDLDGVAAMVLSAKERASFDELPYRRRAETFLAYWTRKEALAKATGEGLGRSPDELEVVPFTEESVVLSWGGSDPGRDRGRTAGFRLVQLRPAPGYIGALAVEGDGWRLREVFVPGP